MAFLFGGKKMEIVSQNAATEKDMMADRLFDMVERNKQTIGVKVYASIPVECLAIDESYQRTDTYSLEKVNGLTAHFDIQKMDTLFVSVHTEEKRYYIIDGMHRYLAAKENGITELPCEIQDFGTDPIERRRAEAKRFIEQQIGIDPMKPIDQHKGHLICGDKEYIDFDSVANELGLHIKNNKKKGKQPEGTITGYTEAVDRTRWYGKQHIKDVFEILIAAKWHTIGKGLGTDAINMVSQVLIAHNSNEEVKREIARVLSTHEPDYMFVHARLKYWYHNRAAGRAMFLEDYVCTSLNIPRLIDKEVKERFTPDVA